jgi:YndJ-like protein
MKFKDSTAAFFVRASPATILAGMTLACVYAFGKFLGKNWIFIPAMARAHGLLNGIGFVLVGLLGWIIELTEIPSEPIDEARYVPRSKPIIDIHHADIGCTGIHHSE